ncbi:MAG: cytochrome c oxidase assembly protein [Candidatus Methylomirabilales bacterium]
MKRAAWSARLRFQARRRLLVNENADHLTFSCQERSKKMMMVGQAKRICAAVAMAVAIGVYLWLHAATTKSAEVAVIPPDPGPQEVLQRYLEALYARDYRDAYRLIASVDMELKNEEEYLRENESFSGAALTLARTLASFIEYHDVHTELQNERATVRFTVKLPNANDPAIRALLFDFDAERLSGLTERDLQRLGKELEGMWRRGDLPMIDGQEAWELVKGPEGWRVFLNWAGAVRVQFEAEVKDGLPWKFWPVQEAVLAKPGETLQAVYRAKNLSDKPVTAKAMHIDGPKEIADTYLQIIQCFCFIQQTLDPGEEKEFPLVFRIHWDAPDTVKALSVRYEFYPIESFPRQGPTG